MGLLAALCARTAVARSASLQADKSWKFLLPRLPRYFLKTSACAVSAPRFPREERVEAQNQETPDVHDFSCTAETKRTRRPLLPISRESNGEKTAGPSSHIARSRPQNGRAVRLLLCASRRNTRRQNKLPGPPLKSTSASPTQRQPPKSNFQSKEDCV